MGGGDPKDRLPGRSIAFKGGNEQARRFVSPDAGRASAGRADHKRNGSRVNEFHQTERRPPCPTISSWFRVSFARRRCSGLKSPRSRPRAGSWSPTTRAIASMEAIARVVGAPERFALAGLSMGGYAALAVMRLAPERVTRLALLDTSARPDTEEARQ